MKVSIITVCLNSKKTILYTLSSVISQNYKNIEHVIVDGGSTDGTKEILKKYQNKKKKIIFANGKSLYESLNIGIKESNGNLISILHSDDIYNNDNVISQVVKKVKKSNYKIFFGDVVYFSNKNFSKIKRYYPAQKLNKDIFNYGNMPPHTGSFYKRDVFNKYGLYNKDFKIAGDFEHLFRLIFIKNLKFKPLNLIITRMKTGGLSGRNLNSFFIINNEILKTFQIYNIKKSLFEIFFRVPPKIFQYIFLDQDKLNKNFRFKINKLFQDEVYNKINLIQNIKKLNFEKNFILSALNLAFVGSLSRNQIELHKDLINWPDGIFSKIYQKKVKKIPGRKIMKDIKLDKKINRILVLGNLSKKGKKYLKSRFNVKIIHKSLPFGTANEISKNIKINIKKNDLIFLTLPTPKQEQVADYLRVNNKYFKIICIGGSIGIVAGDEKEVPKSLFYFEFLWRLRYETFRRLKRLLITFYQYISDIFVFNRLKNIQIKIIDK
jgi:glycosyltransferase involved in cell wall biosynthesis